MTNLFDKPPQQDDTPHIETDDNVNYLDQLVGEGKKFKTPEELAKGKFIADGYVDHLKHRLDELRGDYTKLREEQVARAKLEELLDQINSKQQQQKPDTTNHQQSIQEKAPFDPSEIEGIVSKKIQENESNRRQQDNYKIVKDKLLERFGNNYQAVLREQTESLGLSEEFVNTLALNHPQVLFKTLGFEEKRGELFQSPPRSNMRSDSFKPNVQKRTWSYYQNLKRENPNKYRDPQTHVQMWKDHVELGTEFEDGDFHN